MQQQPHNKQSRKYAQTHTKKTYRGHSQERHSEQNQHERSHDRRPSNNKNFEIRHSKNSSQYKEQHKEQFRKNQKSTTRTSSINQLTTADYEKYGKDKMFLIGQKFRHIIPMPEKIIFNCSQRIKNYYNAADLTGVTKTFDPNNGRAVKTNRSNSPNQIKEKRPKRSIETTMYKQPKSSSNFDIINKKNSPFIPIDLPVSKIKRQNHSCVKPKFGHKLHQLDLENIQKIFQIKWFDFQPKTPTPRYSSDDQDLEVLEPKSVKSNTSDASCAEISKITSRMQLPVNDYILMGDGISTDQDSSEYVNKNVYTEYNNKLSENDQSASIIDQKPRVRDTIGIHDSDDDFTPENSDNEYEMDQNLNEMNENEYQNQKEYTTTTCQKEPIECQKKDNLDNVEANINNSNHSEYKRDLIKQNENFDFETEKSGQKIDKHCEFIPPTPTPSKQKKESLKRKKRMIYVPVFGVNFVNLLGSKKIKLDLNGNVVDDNSNQTIVKQKVKKKRSKEKKMKPEQRVKLKKQNPPERKNSLSSNCSDYQMQTTFNDQIYQNQNSNRPNLHLPTHCKIENPTKILPHESTNFDNNFPNEPSFSYETESEFSTPHQSDNDEDNEDTMNTCSPFSLLEIGRKRISKKDEIINEPKQKNNPKPPMYAYKHLNTCKTIFSGSHCYIKHIVKTTCNKRNSMENLNNINDNGEDPLGGSDSMAATEIFLSDADKGLLHCIDGCRNLINGDIKIVKKDHEIDELKEKYINLAKQFCCMVHLVQSILNYQLYDRKRKAKMISDRNNQRNDCPCLNTNNGNCICSNSNCSNKCPNSCPNIKRKREYNQNDSNNQYENSSMHQSISEITSNFKMDAIRKNLDLLIAKKHKNTLPADKDDKLVRYLINHYIMSKKEDDITKFLKTSDANFTQYKKLLLFVNQNCTSLSNSIQSSTHSTCEHIIQSTLNNVADKHFKTEYDSRKVDINRREDDIVGCLNDSVVKLNDLVRDTNKNLIPQNHLNMQSSLSEIEQLMTQFISNFNTELRETKKVESGILRFCSKIYKHYQISDIFKTEKGPKCELKNGNEVDSVR